MRFLKWLKSLFTKSSQGTPTPAVINNTSQQNQNAKGWQKEWTDFLIGEFSKRLSSFDKAFDRSRLNANYDRLDSKQRATLWAELFKAMAYYESGYNPNSQSVDVGTKENRNTWSIGLLQMSVVDQANHSLPTSFSFDELLMPLNNLLVALLVMEKQILRRGKIFIPQGEPGVYWAVIRPGGKYDKTEKILAVVRALNFNAPATPLHPADPATPWMEVAENEMGVSEIAGSKDNPRIVDYHSSTTLKAQDDETAWCASFVCWVLQKANYKSTRSAWARDYLNYGTKINAGKFGAIVVFTRGTSSGHVAFYIKEDSKYIWVLGGNQSNQVNISKYEKSRVLGYRWPVTA